MIIHLIKLFHAIITQSNIDITYYYIRGAIYIRDKTVLILHMAEQWLWQNIDQRFNSDTK